MTEVATPCPVCDSNEARAVTTVERVPVLCNLLYRTREAALSAEMAQIRLAFCEGCGHVWNARFEPERVQYGPDYENSLHFSGRFQRYADELAESLRDRYLLSGKRIVEIGCGQGDFLRALCALGANAGFGYDPSSPKPDPAARGSGEDGVTLSRRPFAPELASVRPDLVCCRHCLEHIAAPRELLRALRSGVGTDCAVYFEVPNALYTLRDAGIWDLIYEHCGYFTPSSLRRAFARCGFEVVDVTEAFEGQFLGLHARASLRDCQVAAEDERDVGAVRALVGKFADAFGTKVGEWRAHLQTVRDRGQRAVVWGAGSKGNTFLQLAGPHTEYVVDINPRKHGKFVAGTGQQIVAPDFLRGYRPDLVVAMNPIYADEIRRQLGGLGVEAELLCA